jgi:sugar/nucleoside kinase (ribokinase family)
MPDRKYHPRVVVLGDLVVDVVLAPSMDLATGTDVPGRVMLRQGGSATTTALWLGRCGARAALVAAVGRDAEGRSLVEAVRRAGVTPHVVRIAGYPTGRIGVLVAPGGERSFVQDRAATLRLAPEHLREAWFAGADLLHLPTYSLLDGPLGDAGRRAASLAHAAGALVTVDLSSSHPLLALGLSGAAAVIASVRPDLLFSAGAEARAIAETDDSLLDVAPIVVLKRGSAGATVLFRDGTATGRIEVAAKPVPASDTTGAGDAFDAGFILGWLQARREETAPAAGLRRAALAGNRLAARQLLRRREELEFD